MTSTINQAFTPFPILQSGRLTLRALRMDDAPAVFAIFSDPEVTRYYDVPTMKRPAQADKLVGWWLNRIKNRKALRWAITWTGGDDCLVGTGGFSLFDKPNHLAEIGLDITRAQWGHGIGTEVVGAVLDFGFRVMQLHRIETWVTVENKASLRMVRKNGFLTEGLLRQRRFWQGQYQDVEMFGLLREEYLRARPAP